MTPLRHAAQIGSVSPHRDRRDQVRVAEHDATLAGEHAFARRRRRLVAPRTDRGAEMCVRAMQQRGQRFIRIAARIEMPYDETAIEPSGISRMGTRGAWGFR